MASCWVMVEPPSETPRCSTSATTGAENAPRIDAVMRIEAAVLDGDEGVGHVIRQFGERHRRAAHVAAGGERRAIVAEDQHRGRPLGDFQRLDRRQMDADPDQRADAGDHAPTAPAPRPNRTGGRCRNGALPPRRALRARARRALGGCAVAAAAGGPPMRSAGRRRRSKPSASPVRLRRSRHAISRPQRRKTRRKHGRAGGLRGGYLLAMPHKAGDGVLPGRLFGRLRLGRSAG